MNEDLVAVEAWDSGGEHSVLANMIGLSGDIVESSIEVDSHKLGNIVGLRCLSCGKVKREVGIKIVCHESASTLSQPRVEVINDLLN